MSEIDEELISAYLDQELSIEELKALIISHRALLLTTTSALLVRVASMRQRLFEVPQRRIRRITEFMRETIHA